MRYDTPRYLWNRDAAEVIDEAPVSSGVLLSSNAPSPPAGDPATPQTIESGVDGEAPRPSVDAGEDEVAPDPIDAPAAAVGEDAPGAPVAPLTAEDVDAAQILRERPDVYAAFYREYYGPNNDRNSDAWVDRVGGETPEDYARYWYKTYAFFEGYTPGANGGGLGAPAEDAGVQGRTTLDGVPLAKILGDRPDVFQAFFTEYYGAGNDRHSDAWAQRVGGTTVEDYANYWYNAYGKMAGYVPSAPPPAAPADGPPPEPTDPAPTDDLAPVVDADPPVDAADPPAAPFIYSDPEAPMLPLGPGRSLFDPDPFAT